MSSFIFYYKWRWLLLISKEKVQMKVGEVIECKPVEGAKKLLVSQIKIGKEVRQIVSGIAQYYKPEELVGKKVVVVTNLPPREMKGYLSEGMIVCAEDEIGNISLYKNICLNNLINIVKKKILAPYSNIINEKDTSKNKKDNYNRGIPR